ncbi:MAG: hypothetical protein ABW318_19935 [Vicinamibacterales bacterium]
MEPARRNLSSNARGNSGRNDLIPATPSLVDAMWDHGSTDGEIFDSIKNGVAPVPFKDQLKDQVSGTS